jgi:hypothetical protein
MLFFKIIWQYRKYRKKLILDLQISIAHWIWQNNLTLFLPKNWPNHNTVYSRPIKTWSSHCYKTGFIIQYNVHSFSYICLHSKWWYVQQSNIFYFNILCFYYWEYWFILNLSLKSCHSWITVTALSYVECMLKGVKLTTVKVNNQYYKDIM